MRDIREIEQKLVVKMKSHYAGMSLLGPSGSDGYLASQCSGNAGLQKDLDSGWIVRGYWEDTHTISFLLERQK